MTQIKKPCKFYTRTGQCDYGEDCRYSHPHDAQILPTDPQVRMINDTAPSKKKCNNFWETGDCRHGFKCRYQHISNPTLKPKSDDHEPEDWTLVNTHSTSTARAIDPTFPSYATIHSRISDELLVPAKMLFPGLAKRIIQEASQEGRKITSVSIAESLIQSLNASNRLNEYWVSWSFQALLTRRLSKTGRVSSLPLRR